MSLLGRHRVRAAFYHIGALLFLGFTFLQYVGILSAIEAFYLTSALFVIDWLAEMFDPHPENPGPWWNHFHRIWDNKDD